MKKVLRFIHPLLVLTLALLLASSACGGKQTTSGTPVYLGELQKNGNISVRFFGLMTFNGLGATVSLPAELAIPSLSITWMGHIFTGGGDDVGAGEEITYQVHGTASQDGLWLDTLSYSRQVIWKGKNSGTFYRVTMTNVPIATMSGGKPVGQGTCNISGPNLQKYITRIEYADGPVINGIIKADTVYVSTDWNTTVSGWEPSLVLKMAPGPASGSSGGGMMN